MDTSRNRQQRLYGQIWREADYVLVLDAYMRHRDKPRSRTSPFVLELAALLGRTPASIYMRLENFASLDPAENRTRRGLARVAEYGASVYARWASEPKALAACAEFIRRERGEADNDQLSAFDSSAVAIPHAFIQDPSPPFSQMPPPMTQHGSSVAAAARRGAARYTAATAMTNAAFVINFMLASELSWDVAKRSYLRESAYNYQ